MKTYRNCILLFLFCLFLYGTFSGLIPLLDPDEPVYGETAKEMLATGDWISPRIYGEFWYDKPPLFYWLEAISFSIFGVSTWAARLPSVLLGALTPCYLFLSSRRFLGERAALRAGFICATSLEIIVLARSSVTDMLLCLTLTVALMSFLRKEYAAAYIACGLALLTKGPVGFGFPALIVGLWLIFSRQFDIKHIMGLKWYWGIPLACLVGLPWYIEMGMLHGDAFIDTFLGYHNITRFVAPEHAGQNHYWLYIVVVLAGFYPWSGTLPGLLKSFREWRKDKVMLYFIVWALFIFLFFSVSSTQLFSYILPMVPPLAILSSAYLARIEETGHISKAFIICHVVFALITTGAVAFVPFSPEGGPIVHYAIAGLMVLAAFFSASRLAKGRFHAFFMTQAALILVFVLSVWGAFEKPVSDLFTSRAIAEKTAAESLDPDVPLYIDPFYRPSFAFYEDLYGKALPDFDKRKQQVDEKNKENGVLLPGLEEPARLPDQAYILIQKKLYKNWPDEEKKDLTLIWEKDTAYLFRKGNSEGSLQK